jgi:hypothetical protein
MGRQLALESWLTAQATPSKQDSGICVQGGPSGINRQLLRQAALNSKGIKNLLLFAGGKHYKRQT